MTSKPLTTKAKGRGPTVALALAIVIMLLMPNLTSADNSAGGLDEGFGEGGKLLVDSAPFSSLAGITFEPGGKFIVAGGNITHILLARFNRDGSPDAGFGSNGVVTIDPGGNFYPGALALQPDGKTIVAGARRRANEFADFFLVRINPDGSVDESFGANGFATADFDGGNDSVSAIALLPRGKIAVAGSMTGNTAQVSFALALFLSDGRLDPSFGDQGRVATPIGYDSLAGAILVIVAFFGKQRLSDISPFRVESFKIQRLKTPVVYKKVEKPRSSAAVNRELQLLSRIFTLAMEKKEVVENPVSQIELLKGERKRKRRLHHEERARLFEALQVPGSQGKRWHLAPIITLDLNTGLRRTELLSLKVTDVDFLRNVIRATETKNGEDREVEMNATARSLLVELVTQAKGQGWEYIFTNPLTGTHYKDVKKAFNNAVRDAGIEDFRFHDLRHTFASTAGDDPGVAVTALAETLGHKDVRTTMRYTHASKAGKLRVVQAQERREMEDVGHNSVTNEKRQAS